MKFYVVDQNVKTIDKIKKAGCDVMLSFCYLDGKIEEDAGYDMVCPERMEDFSKLNKIDHDILDVTVVFTDGTEHEAKFYFWHRNGIGGLRRGLIVYPDDESANDYANAKYNEKAMLI